MSELASKSLFSRACGILQSSLSPEIPVATAKRPTRPAPAKTDPDYPIHEHAARLPEMAPDEFAAFKEDLKLNGQLDDVVLLNGQIIDGRHRYRALRELGMTNEQIGFRDYDHARDGTDPLAFVISGNFYRRHLTAEQKAMFAAEMIGYKPFTGKPVKGAKTAKDVAAIAGVSIKTVNRAFNTPAEKAPAEPAAPTLESLQQQRKMIVGRLAKIDEQIAELQALAKPKVVARAPASRTAVVKRPAR